MQKYKHRPWSPEIKGFIGSEAAKAAAIEVLGNFRRTDFGKLDARK